MSEELTNYLKDMGIKVAYLHSEIKTLERIEIIRDLRAGVYDVLVGINLLREGLDIPEVSLVAILDADKEGFLRSERSLIQTIGRAARNADGRVILFADKMTNSTKKAILETDRRREIQKAFNKAHGITPQTVKKDIRAAIRASEDIKLDSKVSDKNLTKSEKEQLISRLETEMADAAKALDFETAASLRDVIIELKAEKPKKP